MGDFQRSLSHTSMSTWRRCRYKYFLKYVENYETTTSKGMRRGSIGHAALAVWYGTGSEVEAIQAANDKLEEYEQQYGEVYEEDWNLMVLILNRYFDWSKRHDDFEVIASEIKFKEEIQGVKVTGIIDGIIRDKQGVNWLLEHKFQQAASLKHLELDPQVSFYMLMARKMGYNPRGTFFNIIRVREGGIAEREPVLRGYAYRNNEALQFIEDEIVVQAKEIVTFHEDGGTIYRNPTKDCNWDCSFHSVCLGINDDGKAEPVLRNWNKVDYGKEQKERKKQGVYYE